MDGVEEYVPKELTHRRFPIELAIDEKPRFVLPSCLIQPPDSIVQSCVTLLESR
jgi:hypothetical protein